MRYPFQFLVLTLLLLAACRSEQTPPTVTPSPAAPAPFADSPELEQARLLLIQFLTQVDRLEVPAVNEWEPATVEQVGEQATYLFTSDGWELRLTEPRPGRTDVIWHTVLSGPGDFLYLADIELGGGVAPAQ